MQVLKNLVKKAVKAVKSIFSKEENVVKSTKTNKVKATRPTSSDETPVMSLIVKEVICVVSFIACLVLGVQVPGFAAIAMVVAAFFKLEMVMGIFLLLLGANPLVGAVLCCGISPILSWHRGGSKKGISEGVIAGLVTLIISYGLSLVFPISLGLMAIYISVPFIFLFTAVETMENVKRNKVNQAASNGGAEESFSFLAYTYAGLGLLAVAAMAIYLVSIGNSLALMGALSILSLGSSTKLMGQQKEEWRQSINPIIISSFFVGINPSGLNRYGRGVSGVISEVMALSLFLIAGAGRGALGDLISRTGFTLDPIVLFLIGAMMIVSWWCVKNMKRRLNVESQAVKVMIPAALIGMNLMPLTALFAAVGIRLCFKGVGDKVTNLMPLVGAI